MDYIGHGILQARILESVSIPFSRGSPGQNTGVGSHSLLRGIFPIPGSNPGLPHCRQIFYSWATREDQRMTNLNYLSISSIFASCWYLLLFFYSMYYYFVHLCVYLILFFTMWMSIKYEASSYLLQHSHHLKQHLVQRRQSMNIYWPDK